MRQPGSRSRSASDRWLAAVVAGVLFSCGCDVSPSSSPSLPPDDGLVSPAPTLSVNELTEASRFRTDFGLRTDDAWIAAVARDPGSDRTTYGVPLSAAEVEELGRRIRDVNQIRAVVITYGEAHPQDWGGAWIYQEAGGVLVAQFTAHIELHRLALWGQIWPNAKLEIRQVRWTQGELLAAKERVKSDDAWFATLPASISSIGIDDSANRVVVRLSSPNPSAPQLVAAHFGLDESLLDVSSDGTGADLLERGTLTVEVVDPSGRPVAGVGCAAYSDLPGASDPHPMPMPITDASGMCHLVLRATGYWIQIERLAEPPEVIAIARAIVSEGKSGSIRVIATH